MLARRSAAGLAVVGAVWLYTFVLTASHVSSASLAQQKAAAAWIAAQPEMRPGTRIATPRPYAEYFMLTPFLARAGLEPVVVAEGDWLGRAADVLVVPDVLAIGVRRDHPDGAAARDLVRLESGDGGFHEAARWPMEYLHQRLYAWLDPGLSPVLGACGFTVYVRDRAR
jgi:hypothetical protein